MLAVPSHRFLWCGQAENFARLVSFCLVVKLNPLDAAWGPLCFRFCFSPYVQPMAMVLHPSTSYLIKARSNVTLRGVRGAGGWPAGVAANRAGCSLWLWVPTAE